MKNKKAINMRYVPFLIIGFIFLIIYFGFFQTSSILQEETKTINWKGYSVVVSGAFGEFTNTKRFQFCGSNDGDVKIINKIEPNEKLTSFAYLSTEKRACTSGIPIKPSENKITMILDLPPGVFKANCENVVEAKGRGGDVQGVASCIVKKDNTEIKLNENIVLNKNSRIITEQITATDDIAVDYLSSSKLTLSFTPKEEIKEEKYVEQIDFNKQQASVSFFDKIKSWIKNLIKTIFGG
jgi:hypothetical protein